MWVEIAAGYRLSRPKGCSESVYEVMLDCWRHEPEDRPTFATLAGSLKQILARDHDWIEEGEYLSVEDEPKKPVQRSFFGRLSSKMRSSATSQLNLTYWEGQGQGAVQEEGGELYHVGQEDVGNQSEGTGNEMYDMGGEEMENQSEGAATEIYDMGDETEDLDYQDGQFCLSPVNVSGDDEFGLVHENGLRDFEEPVEGDIQQAPKSVVDGVYDNTEDLVIPTEPRTGKAQRALFLSFISKGIVCV